MPDGELPAAGIRTLFFGLPSGVSAAALDQLLISGFNVAAVIVSARSVPHLLAGTDDPFTVLEPYHPAGLSIAGTDQVDTLGVAWAAAVPVLAVGDFAAPQTLVALSEFAADVAVVACFAQRLPPAVLDVPRYGFLNIHPSLLPHYRGPTPVFWQLRDGATTGATIHYMDEGLDTGDIAAQVSLPLPDGITEAQAERQLMLAGIDLLRDVLPDLARGAVHRRPQSEEGSYFGFPDEGDFELSVSWPARRAYNFMRGTAARGMSYPIEVNGRVEWLAFADHYEPDLKLDRLSVRHGRSILIRFNPGILYARLRR